MAIAKKGTGAATDWATETSGAALQPPCPAVVDAGDILIAQVYFEGTTTAPDTPSGWTLLDGPRTVESHARMWLYGRIADGSEDGAAVLFGTQAVTTMRAARIYSFSGRVSGTITQLVRGFSFLSHATDPNFPTVTTTEAGNLAVAFVGQNDNNSQPTIAGESGGEWTESWNEYEATLTPGLALAAYTSTPTGDPGTITGGSGVTADDPVGILGFEVAHTVASVGGGHGGLLLLGVG